MFNSITHKTEPLFKRIPDTLLQPLASKNRNRYWHVLNQLHYQVFGPDAPLPPSRGHSMRFVTERIQDILLTIDMWDSDEGLTPDMSFDNRAQLVFYRLLDCGWFIRERYAGDYVVSMRPAVSHFLNMLCNFAERGPVFISSKIRMIDSGLNEIMQHKAHGDTLNEVAMMSRDLLEHIRHTSTNIGDIMERLNLAETTSDYVRMFFSDYIEKVFIGDYRELRTTDHPLSRRPQIIHMIEELYHNDQHRDELITWFQQKHPPCKGDRHAAIEAYERNIFRLRELNRIDEFLDRLDEEIRKANKRALAYLDYRLRSLRPIDNLIKDTIESLSNSTLTEIISPFGPELLISGNSLQEPRIRRERSAPMHLRRETPSKEQLAKSILYSKAREVRTVTPHKLAEFVQQHLQDRDSVDFYSLPISNNQELRCLQAITQWALAFKEQSPRLTRIARSNCIGFGIRIVGTNEMLGQGLSSVPLTIEPRRSKLKSKDKITP